MRDSLLLAEGVGTVGEEGVEGGLVEDRDA